MFDNPQAENTPVDGQEEIVYEDLWSEEPKPTSTVGTQATPQGEAPVTADRLAELLQQDLQHRTTIAQQHEQAEAQRRLQEQQRAAREQLTARQQEMQQRNQAAIDRLSLPKADLTPEEQKVWADHKPTIEKMLRQQLADYSQQHLAPTIKELLEAQTKVSEELQNVRSLASREESIDVKLERRIPDVQSVVNSPEFRSWQEQEVPTLGGVTYRELAWEGYQSGDVRKVQLVVDAFKQTRGQKPREPVNPRGAHTGAGPEVRRKTMLRMSDLDKAYDKYDKGTIDAEKLRAMEAMFAQAHAEGRVDLTK